MNTHCYQREVTEDVFHHFEWEDNVKDKLVNELFELDKIYTTHSDWPCIKNLVSFNRVPME